MHTSSLSAELIVAIERGDTVIAPSNRASYQLKAAYAQYAITQSRKSWLTPKIFSFDHWAQQLWRTHAQDWRAIRLLSSEQSLLAWTRVVSESKRSAELLSPQAAARASYRSWQRLIEWRITRDDLASHTASGANETLALLEWSNSFLKRCAANDWLPIALVPERLLDIQVTNTQNILTLTTTELLPMQIALLRHVEKNGANWQTLATNEQCNSVVAVAADSAEHELFLAAQWAERQLQDNQLTVGIVVPELAERAAQVTRIFNERFAPSERTLSATSTIVNSTANFSVASPQSLLEFAVVRAAIDILLLVAGRAASTLAGSLLRNPFLGDSEQEAGCRALADTRLRSQIREHYDLQSLLRIANAASCSLLSARLTAAHSLVQSIPARALPSAMAELFVALWRAFGWPGEMTLSSHEQQVVARLHECLAEFGALDELLGTQNLSAAVREFEQLAANTRFAPRVLPTQITVVDIGDVDCLRFDALWITGIEATRWPSAAEPDVFIPIDLQLQANMPFASARATRALSAQRFLQLRAAAPTVVMSWPKFEDDIALSPSPWLQSFPTMSDDVSARESAAESVAYFAAYRDALFSARPALEILTETGAPALPSARAKGGAKIFELQSLCPFRAQAELRLQAQPLDEVAPSIDANDRGTLVHAALADIWRALRDSAHLHATSTEELEVLVRTALASHANKLCEGATPYRVRIVQIEQEIAAQRILELLAIDKTRAPFRVIGDPEKPEVVTVDPLQVDLRLDRMDESLAADTQGARIIIDYKTGSTIDANGWFAARPTQPQLPLYASTHSQNLSAVAFATLSAKSTGYFGVANADGLLPNVREFDARKLPAEYHNGQEQSWQGLLRYWRAVIERLATDYSRGVANVDPLASACRYCHLATLCRVHELSDPNLRAELQEEDVS